MNYKIIAMISTTLLMLSFSGYSLAQSDVNYSDSTISSNVNDSLSAAPSLSGVTVKGTAMDGVVSLSGNVNSATQADAAITTAQSVPGVKDVDTKDLIIADSQQPIADAIITAKIKGMFMQHKLFGNDDIASISIKVETNDGVVSLSGDAENQEQISNAVAIAKAVSGVKDVKSTIQMSPITQ